MKKHPATPSPASSGAEDNPKFEILPADPSADGAAGGGLVSTTGDRLLTRAEFRGLQGL